MRDAYKEQWLKSIFLNKKGFWSLEAKIGTSMDLPLPQGQELALARTMGSKRSQEFLLGRQLIQKGLLELGHAGGPILMGPNGEPIWPEGLSGSITHHRENVWVVLSTDDTLVGIDLEATSRLKPALWKKILTPEEIEWIHKMPMGTQNQWATFIFSAKEAYFKMQFQKTQARLGFLQGSVELLVLELNLVAESIHGQWKIEVPCAKIASAQGYFWIDRDKTYTIAMHPKWID